MLILLSAIFLNGQEIDSARIYLQVANTALSKGEYQTAIENYKSVLRFRPEHPAVTYNIACCYSLLNNKPQALKWLAKAIELGLYSFDEDEDLNNIRDTKEYKKLLNKADKLLKQMKQEKFEPVIILPSDYDTNKIYPLLICMHGWGSNPVDLSKNFQKIPDYTEYIVCCPYGVDIMGKTSFGWGERDSADKRIRETIEYMNSRYKIDKEKIILLGFSQGGTMAYYIGLKNADFFKGVIAIAGYYDSTFNQLLPNAQNQNIKFVVMLGEDEPEYRIKANLDGLNQLIKSGISVSFQVYSGYGHTIPGDVDFEIKRAIDWLEK
ncbi:MAG: dienelactone hydrolase family protein [candidate division WOR-3 bacterium]